MTADLFLPPPGLDALLAHLGLAHPELLGSGGESVVYALDDERVVRVPRTPSIEALASRKALLDSLDTSHLAFAIPHILEIGEHEGTTFAIERRLPGSDLAAALGRLEGDARTRALTEYVVAAGTLRSVAFERPWFGELLGDTCVRRPTWSGYLSDRIHQCLQVSLPDLRSDLTDVDACIAGFERELDRVRDVEAPVLAHGDWCAWNVMVDDEGGLTAAIDFSVLSVACDWRMDAIDAVIYLELVETATAEDQELVARVAHDEFGSEVLALTDLYRWYASLYFSFTKHNEPGLYQWCVANLEALTRRR